MQPNCSGLQRAFSSKPIRLFDAEPYVEDTVWRVAKTGNEDSSDVEPPCTRNRLRVKPVLIRNWLPDTAAAAENESLPRSSMKNDDSMPKEVSGSPHQPPVSRKPDWAL